MHERAGMTEVEKRLWWQKLWPLLVAYFLGGVVAGSFLTYLATR